jgi:probable HAF family extracellular repeat protein
MTLSTLNGASTASNGSPANLSGASTASNGAPTGINGALSVLAGTVATVALCMAAATATAQPCGVMEEIPVPGSNGVWVSGISAEGRVVIGSADVAGQNRAFRWSQDAGVQFLSSPGGVTTAAYGATANGALLVGAIRIGIIDLEACMWTSGGDPVRLGTLFGYHSTARGVSSDGSVVVGMARSQFAERAFKWTSASGMTDLGTLGTPWPQARSNARACSGDGSVVVGESSGLSGDRAFRWTPAGGMVDLGTLGGTNSSATGTSFDGGVVVGVSETPTGTSAFRWTATTGMQRLSPDLGSYSRANACSSDGAVVVGSTNWNVPTRDRAVRWTTPSGMQQLGVLSGDVESVAVAVSGDGSIVVGNSTDAAGRSRAFRWVNTPPVVSQQPLASNICRTNSALFNVIVSSPNPITYRWRKAGVPIDIVANQSAATDTLRLVRVQASDAGLYDCIVSTDCGSVTSAAARLTVRTCICLEADIAGGGDAGNEPDGTVDGTDFIAFINSFAIGDAAVDPLADIAGGGDTGLEPDGTIDGTDFIFFINAFAIGC